MKWIKQKRGTVNCGQIALAHLTGISYQKIVKMVGHERETCTTNLVRVLRKLGYKCHNRLRVFKTKPQLAIAKLTYPDTYRWHWVVINGNKIYDGYYGNKSGKVNWKKSWRITSYLPVEKLASHRLKGKINE